MEESSGADAFVLCPAASPLPNSLRKLGLYPFFVTFQIRDFGLQPRKSKARWVSPHLKVLLERGFGIYVTPVIKNIFFFGVKRPSFFFPLSNGRV